MRSTGIISTKLGKNHHWEGIEVCSNEGPCLSTKGDKKKLNYMKIFKNFLLQNHWASLNQTFH